MTVEIRRAIPSDVEHVNAFYASQQRGGGASVDDYMLLAEHEGRIVGVVRLCQEELTLVLRGMLIDGAFRRQGLGKRMLKALEPAMQEQDCFCLPWAHLETFYATVGFEAVDEKRLPSFLRDRLEEHHHQLGNPDIQRGMQDDLGVYPSDGLRFIAMKRPSS